MLHTLQASSGKSSPTTSGEAAQKMGVGSRGSPDQTSPPPAAAPAPADVGMGQSSSAPELRNAGIALEPNVHRHRPTPPTRHCATVASACLPDIRMPLLRAATGGPEDTSSLVPKRSSASACVLAAQSLDASMAHLQNGGTPSPTSKKKPVNALRSSNGGGAGGGEMAVFATAAS